MNSRQAVFALALLVVILAVLAASYYALSVRNYGFIAEALVVWFVFILILALFLPRMAPRAREWATTKPQMSQDADKDRTNNEAGSTGRIRATAAAAGWVETQAGCLMNLTMYSPGFR